jgi:hypothetical protein
MPPTTVNGKLLRSSARLVATNLARDNFSEPKHRVGFDAGPRAAQSQQIHVCALLGWYPESAYLVGSFDAD